MILQVRWVCRWLIHSASSRYHFLGPGRHSSPKREIPQFPSWKLCFYFSLKEWGALFSCLTIADLWAVLYWWHSVSWSRKGRCFGRMLFVRCLVNAEMFFISKGNFPLLYCCICHFVCFFNHIESVMRNEHLLLQNSYVAQPCFFFADQNYNRYYYSKFCFIFYIASSN